MNLLNFADRDFAAGLAAFCGSAAVSPEIAGTVAAILAEVREKGDAAVARYAAKFDGARLGPRDFRVAPAELAAAYRRLPAAERRALTAARANIVDFNRRSLPPGWSARNRQGAWVGEKFDPIRRVGLYVPGGNVPLVSTVLMTALLAKIAGCPEVAVFTPSKQGGKIAPGLLAALHLAGVTEVYRIGGVQAIAAMAFGTASIPAVDKIFGPGNAYVCEAKRQVFGTVGVDSLPGPSEVMVIADETASPDCAAADLLAQAEHGSGREKIYLVATSAKIISDISGAVDRQVRGGRDGLVASASAQRPLAQPKVVRSKTPIVPPLALSPGAARVLNEGFIAIRVRNLAQAAAVANRVAPEHLELLVKDSAIKSLTEAVTTAGAIMIGNDTPTALGDFTAGPSHVLPTAGTGRFLSGLRVADFLRRTSVVRYDRASLRRAAPVVSAFAAMEQLPLHGRSVTIRAD